MTLNVEKEDRGFWPKNGDMNGITELILINSFTLEITSLTVLPKPEKQ